jgi:hypothetical protein
MKVLSKNSIWLVERFTRLEKRVETAPCTPGLRFCLSKTDLDGKHGGGFKKTDMYD